MLTDPRLACLHGRLCYVCGKTFKDSAAFVPKNIRICSDLCKQWLVFMQGFICGNVLTCAIGLLVRKEAELGNKKDCSCSRQNINDRSLNAQKQDYHYDYVKSEPLETKAILDADLESNHDEELLPVIFDQDSKFAQTGNCQVQVLPNMDKNPSGCQSLKNHRRTLTVARKTTSAGPPIVKISSSHQIKKKSKCKYRTQMLMTKRVSAVSNSRDFFDGSLLNIEDISRLGSAADKRRVECAICSEKFIETHLYVHMKAKHLEKLTKEEIDLMYSCSECNKKFDKQSHLNKHLAKKHPNCEKFTKSCTICHKGFSNQIGLSVHMRHVHKALSPKECDLCEKTFKSCKELSRHKLQDHQLRVHICHLCGKNFAYGHALKSHLDAHAGVKKHFCEVCGEGFIRMTSLCGHRISAHSRKDDVIYKCELCECESNFNTKALLNKHLFEYHFTGPFAVKDYRKQLAVVEEQKCQICKDTSENCVKCPIHSAEDSKEFICSHCGKKFSKSHYLKAHEKQHQEAKFSCDICCKRFTYKCNLKAHHSTHSSDKPFQCSICMKKFRLKFLLEDHQRTHNRDLLFKCYICGRGLTRIPNLKRHIKVMHPEVNYEQHVSDLQERNTFAHTNKMASS